MSYAECGTANGHTENRVANGRLFIILLLVTCTVVVIVQWPCLWTKAYCYDDNQYLVENNLVRNPSLASAWRFLTEVFRPSTVRGYYQPLAMISLMLDSAMGGEPYNLYPFHRTSLLLHVLNTALMCVLLYLLFGNAIVACAVGLLYGVHPLTVETLAWIVERKTLVATLFSLSCLIAYVRYVQIGGRRYYVLCIAMYVLALMSKPTSTLLPVAMLLLDFWPLRRLGWKSVREKIPFLCIGVISGIVTTVSQASTAVILTPTYYGISRVPLVIAHDIVFYLQKMVWPTNLAPFYAFPEPMNLSNPLVAAYVVGSVVLVVSLVYCLKWSRAPLTSWLIFMAMILPTMQTLQFSDVIAADKFAYLPSVGILIIIAWALVTWSAHRVHGQHSLRVGLMIVVVLGLACVEAYATRGQIHRWSNTVTLYKYVQVVQPRATGAYNNLAIYYGEQKQYDKAIEELKLLLSIVPQDREAHYNMGVALQNKGDLPGALEWYNKVLKLEPNNIDARVSIASILAEDGKTAEAIALYKEAIRLEVPSHSGYIHRGLGMAMLRAGMVKDAIGELTAATQLLPDSTSHCNLAMVLMSTGDISSATENLSKAIRLDPANAEAHYNLANIYLVRGEFAAAIDSYRSAISLRHDYTKAHGNLAVALVQSGNVEGAIIEFREVVRLAPTDPLGHFNLGRLYATKGLLSDAVAELRTASSLTPDDIGIRCCLGDMLVEKGDVDLARQEYLVASSIDPNNPMVREGLMKLGIINK